MNRYSIPNGLRIPAVIIGALLAVLLVRGGIELLGQLGGPAAVVCVEDVPTCSDADPGQTVTYTCKNGATEVEVTLSQLTCIDGVPRCPQGPLYQAVCEAEDAAPPPASGDVCEAVCGDTHTDVDEECDDGNMVSGDGCSESCEEETVCQNDAQCPPGNECTGDFCVPLCGNGDINDGESCDDGNTLDGDGCSSQCQEEPPHECGNTILEFSEECDDGNTANADGCSAECELENPELCGNTIINPGEQCDDGNHTAADGCGPTCQLEPVCDGDEDCPYPFLCENNFCALQCGNDELQPQLGEQCDDGNLANGDGCSDLCLLDNPELCPNNVVDPGEECDDNNTAPGDGCGPTCQEEDPCTDDDDCPFAFLCEDNFCVYACGNGTLEPHLGEQCDDANTVNGDGCSDICLLDDPLACGNGVVNEGETCDDGNRESGDGCGPFCQLEPVCDGDEDCPYPFLCENNFCALQCGNGNRQTELGEQCDDGNVIPGDGCSDFCQLEGSLCGNNILEPQDGEQCDDGNTANGDGCSDQCVLENPELCPNNVVNPGEQCDDGNTTLGDGCDAFCQRDLDHCGNNLIEPQFDEQCDDGNTANGDGCSLSCQLEDPGACGNGTENPGETCDDGNRINGDGCNEFCQDEELLCGNASVETGEQCDQYPSDRPRTCSYACTNCNLGCPAAPSGCHYVHEEDDAIGPDGCPLTCGEILCVDPSHCGNDILEPAADEQCDDGNTANNDGCSSQCVLENIALCGNGTLNPGEMCDDGNRTNGDGCTEFCQNETDLCGNTVFEPYAGEECEDGNRTNGDGCSSTCQLENQALCGNNVVNPGEECDDGGTEVGDGCDSTCQIEPPCGPGNTCPAPLQCVDSFCTYLCGNGDLDGTEQCDDGNRTNGDGCSYQCRIEIPDPLDRCGNGIHEPQFNEQCDDGNVSNEDQCNNACEIVCTLDSQCPSGQCTDGVCESACGNGDHEPELGEQCDDGNSVNTDQCTNACIRTCSNDSQCPSGECEGGLCTSTCGNGIPEPQHGEQCDDGNTSNEDECNNACVIICTNDSECPSGDCEGGLCTSACGNGDHEPELGEQCDDGNSVNTDQCTNACIRTCSNDSQCPSGECEGGLCTSTCGNGIPEPQYGEQCDDGNQSNTDSCTTGCLLPPSSQCEVNSDCQNGATCVGGICVLPPGSQCDLASDCQSNLCLNGQCTACTADNQCPSGICLSGACALDNNSQCSLNSQCQSNLCLNGQCASCTSNNQCPNGSCVNGACQLNNNQGCTNNAQCLTGLCLNGQCTQCTTSAQCGAGATCSNGTCRISGCGDGDTDVGEQCDDGNKITGDSCTAQCTRACSLNECAVNGQAFCQTMNGRNCNQLTNGQCFECVGPPQYTCTGNEYLFPEAQKLCADMGLTAKNAPGSPTCIQCVAQSLYPAAECPADPCNDMPGAKDFCAGVGRSCENAPESGQCFRCSDGPLTCVGNECANGGKGFCAGLSSLCKTDRTSDICISCVPPPPSEPVCGNAILEGPEQCDDGNQENNDTCTNKCRRTNGQQCTAANQCASGVCTPEGICEPCGTGIDVLCGLHQQCTSGSCVELCGNGKTDTGEQCDSGPNGDARCTPDCKLGVNQQCLEDGECGTNRCVNGLCQFCSSDLQCSSRSCVNGACVNLCGDGVVQRGEACDQGRLNGVAGACTAECLLGNGLTCRRDGECGSGLCLNGQCSSCTDGSQCRSNICANNRCVHFCGDGTLNEGEQCDDGNRLSADGCNRYCERELMSEVAADLVRGGLLDPSDLTQPYSGGTDELERRLREEQLRAAAQGHGPAGSTGPAAVAVMAGGAAAGWAWMRRRRRP